MCQTHNMHLNKAQIIRLIQKLDILQMLCVWTFYKKNEHNARQLTNVNYRVHKAVIFFCVYINKNM